MSDEETYKKILDALNALRSASETTAKIADLARAASVAAKDEVNCVGRDVNSLKEEMHWLRGRMQTAVWGDEPPKLNGITGLRVLIADDDDLLLRAATRLFGSTGIALFLARSVSHAIGIIEDNKIDVAILDLLFPDGSGFDIARRIRNISHCTAIAFLTGTNPAPEQRREMTALNVELLLKPEDGDRIMKIFYDTKKKLDAKVNP